MNFKKIFSLLEDKIDTYNSNFNEVFLDTSALSLLKNYNYKDQKDLEYWAFICATLDYQIEVENRLIPMMNGLIEYLDKNQLYYNDMVEDPEKANYVLSNFDWGNKNKGISHRFIKPTEILVINEQLRNITKKYETIGKYIEFLYDMAKDEDPKYPMRYVFEKFSQKLRKDLPETFPNGVIPDFNKGSAMKRLCLFFRWMVRPYPDLNKWTFISPSHLFPPLDNSIIRIFRRLIDINLKKSTDFQDVIKIYEFLCRINKEDPVRYDFALSRPAIAGYCVKDPTKNKCYCCPLREICRNSKKLPEFFSEDRPLSSEYEKELFERFLKLKKNDFDEVKTEIYLGKKRVDALCHLKKNGWLVIEVEKELNYTAVGQALVYKKLFENHFQGQIGKPAIICGKDDKEINHTCRFDVGIEVFLV